MSIVNNNHCQYQSRSAILCQTNKFSAAAIVQSVEQGEVVTRIRAVFFSSQLEGILPQILVRDPPQFEWNAVRHSYPIAVLVTIFSGKLNIAC